MASHTAANEELVFVNDGRVSGSSTGRNTLDFGRCPMGGLEIEDNNVGKVRAVFVLSAKDKKLLVLPETGSVACFGD